MNKLKFCLFFTVALLIASCGNSDKQTVAAKVVLKKNELGYYRLFVNDKEFFVYGAGVQYSKIDALAEYGGNSIRTWSTGSHNNIDAVDVLDRAQENGLMVLMGLGVTPERRNFDYNDSLKVKEQFNFIIGEVERLKDHPALLGWAIGNELNLKAQNLKVYNAVNDISLKIHEIDPNHPTTTTLAGIGKKEIDYIKEHCTDIDFISIQMYGAIERLKQHIENSGWEGPYMITEWGATGHWEVPRTDWDVAIEQTSKDKAEAFIYRYNQAILPDSVNCLGSYVFFWGQKQERTPTWYGMFLENGNPTEMVDAMQFVWTGKWPENRCPTLGKFVLNGKTAYDNIKLTVGETYHASVAATDYENDSIDYQWEILPESTDLGMGGDYESRPETLISFGASHNQVEITAPHTPGAYRLFVYATDDGNKSATANIPFFVE